MMFEFLIRDPREWRFKTFIKRLRKESGDEYASLLHANVMGILTRDNMHTYNDVENMKWKEIMFKLTLFKKQQEAYVQSMNTLIEMYGSIPNNQVSSNNWFNDPSWDYSLENER